MSTYYTPLEEAAHTMFNAETDEQYLEAERVFDEMFNAALGITDKKEKK